jgi:nicotinamidase-related amidase/flavin reductase (DIM6/NTAB) family NADH-FMN oxidoreductase RutF
VPAAELDGTQLRAAMRQFPTGVTVLLTQGEADVHGMTANGVCSISLDPPLMMVSLDNRSRMKGHLCAGSRFSINMLRASQSGLADRFAGRPCPDFDAPTIGTLGECPVLDETLASLVCDPEQIVPAGDHTMVIARVREARVDDGEPLIFFEGRWTAFPGRHDIFLLDHTHFADRLNSTLEISPATTALVLADMTRGHLDGSIATMPIQPEEARALRERCAHLLAEARRAGLTVAHVFIEYPQDHPLANPFLRSVEDLDLTLIPWTKRRLSRHNVAGSPQARIVDELAPATGELVLNEKRRSSAFFGTSLGRRLEELGIDTLLLAGVSTNTSILHTAFDAFCLDFTVVVLSDCCASFYGRDLHALALANVQSSAGWVMESGELLAKIGSEVGCEPA